MTGDPQSVLAAGDIHGDAGHARLLAQEAVRQGVDGIVQLGDFGFWEHHPDGAKFLDHCARLAEKTGKPWWWVDGNHEAHTTLRQRYGPGGPRHEVTPEGFWTIRPGVFYIPRGNRWVWNDVRLMGLGGAYSVDKPWRLAYLQARITEADEKNRYRIGAGKPERDVAAEVATFQCWWPEEELTDDDVATALADPEPIDILLTHDKPLASSPRWNRKRLPECEPNQRRIQTVVNTLHPRLLLHGHLHYRYTDVVRCGDGDLHTRVEGLSCNQDAQGDVLSASFASSWLRVELRIASDASHAGDQ